MKEKKINYIIEQNRVIIKQNEAILMAIGSILSLEGLEEKQICRLFKKIEKEINKGE